MQLRWRAALLLASVLTIGSSLKADDPSPQQIAEALKRRESSLAAGRAEWEERVTYRAGALTRLDSNPFPAEDETIVASRQLAWDGPLMSFRFEDKTPSLDGSSFVAQTYANVCGGPAGSRAVRTNDSIARPMVTVSDSKHLESREDVMLIPLLLWARPSAGDCYTLDPKACRTLPEKKQVEGRECLIVERPRGTVTDRWYIDCERDCSILRYEVLVNGDRKVRIDVQYHQTKGTGWTPIGWQTIVSDGKGGVDTVRTATVKTLVLGEKPDPRLFELELPQNAPAARGRP